MQSGQNITSFASNSSYVFAGLRVDGTNVRGIFRSIDNGNSWAQTALTSYDIYSIATSGNYVFAGTESNGVYRSTDNGTSFSQAANFGTYSGEVVLVISGSNIFAGMWYMAGGAVYLSTNNGTNWALTSQINSAVKCLAINGGYLFAGTMDGGVYLSTNNGTTFTQTSLNNQEVRSLAVIGSNVFAGTNPNGVYLSTNNGSTWAQTPLNSGRINSLIVWGTNIFAGTNDGNIYQSTNNGADWITRNEGLPTMYIGINSLLIANNYMFAGTQSYSVYRRPLSELIGIRKISTEVPSGFSLSQNYPNPFNPVTKIKFEIPLSPLSERGVGGFVTLKIYNLLGRQVASLIPPLWGGQEGLQPGTYEVVWDGSNYPSGFYFYKLMVSGVEPGDYTETKKMILVK
jgi:photosystem II stability/assembly factor-like uncharacterized protein